jgi:hypothetical protein
MKRAAQKMRTEDETRINSGEGDGGQRRNRTADASLFRAALYQLSYLATW